MIQTDNYYKYPNEGMPGKVKMLVKACKKDDPIRRKEINGHEVFYGESIASLRQQFGGKNEGYLTDTFRGEQHYLSLEPWISEDLNTTCLLIEFHFSADKSRS